MADITIIYYTSNKEDEDFEHRIQDNITNVTDLPIVSVSQKQIHFGDNIYVGDIGQSYLNEWKQILIGLYAVTTKFCIACESDCLYPPDYFNFIPPRDDIVYRYDNVWAYWKNRRKFWKKPKCEGAQICGREFWIERLENMFGQQGTSKELVQKIFTEEERFTGNPVITFLTGDGISTKTSMTKDPSVTELPYWGTSDVIHSKMFL